MRQEILDTLEKQVDPQHTALIIVDPQNDFCSNDGAGVNLMGWDVSRMQGAVQHLNPFIEIARQEKLMIIWTRSIITDDKARPNSRARSFVSDARKRGLAFVEEGSIGADWYIGITGPLANEHVVTKWHYDAFEDTNLKLVLETGGIKTLLLTGFTANVCVETLARHGYINGYYIVLVSDCTDAPTQHEYESTVFNVKNYFGKVATSTEIVEIWQATPEPTQVEGG